MQNGCLRRPYKQLRKGEIKGKNHKKLTEVEEMKKSWHEYTEGPYRKILNDPDNHNCIVSLLEADIQEYEVRWALGSTTQSKVCGGYGVPAELFQILKDDVVEVLHSICQQIWKTQQCPQNWRRSVFIPISKKDNAKICSKYHTTVPISYTSKVMLKILETRLLQ